MDDNYAGADDQKIIGMVNANYGDSKKYRSNIDADMTEYYNMVRGIPEDKPESWMSNRFVPMTPGQIETGLGNLMNMLFSVKPAIRVKPREKGDEKQASIVEKLIHYQMQISDFYEHFYDFVKTLLMYGTAIGKVYWKKSTVMRKIKVDNYEPIMVINLPNPMTGMMMPVPIGKKKVGYRVVDKLFTEYDDPVFENCNLRDIFWDPQSIDIQDSWVIHRTYKSRAHLINMHKEGIYNSNVNNITEESIETRESMETEDAATSRENVPNVTRAKGTERIELLEWWGKYDLHNNGRLVPCVFTLANGKELIRKEENPFWHGKTPFVKGVYVRMPNEFLGLGIPEILYDMQQVMNETVNQRIDNISLILNRMFVAKTNSGININKLKSAPGNVIMTDDENPQSSILPLITPDVTSSSFAETSEIERWAQEATAITKMSMGMSGPGTHDTLGGAQLQQATAGNRFALYARLIENMAIKPIIKMFYDLDTQFVDSTKVARIVGPDGVEFQPVSPEDVGKDYDFVPAGVFSMENKSEKALRLIQWKNIVQEAPYVNHQAVDQKILEYLGEEAPQDYMKTPEEAEKQKNKQIYEQLMQKRAEMSMQTENTIKEHAVTKKIDTMIEGEVAGTPGVPPSTVPVPPNQQVGIPEP